MEIKDERTGITITQGAITGVSKDQSLGIELITNTGFSVFLTQVEAKQIVDLYSNQTFKAKET